MALYGQSLGIPSGNIYIEDKAEHSTENVYYSYKKAKNLGFNRIALATDPYQSKMLKRYLKKYFPMCGSPVIPQGRYCGHCGYAL